MVSVKMTFLLAMKKLQRKLAKMTCQLVVKKKRRKTMCHRMRKLSKKSRKMYLLLMNKLRDIRNQPHLQ